MLHITNGQRENHCTLRNDRYDQGRQLKMVHVNSGTGVSVMRVIRRRDQARKHRPENPFIVPATMHVCHGLTTYTVCTMPSIWRLSRVVRALYLGQVRRNNEFVECLAHLYIRAGGFRQTIGRHSGAFQLLFAFSSSRSCRGGVAQLVEQRTHKPRVTRSIRVTATNISRNLLLSAHR